MEYRYESTKEFKENDLKELFLSVGWSSGNYPEKLVVAMKGAGSVFSAWHEGKLIGLIMALDDGIMNAYIHYLLVRPEFQGKGIGKQLVECVKEAYREYLRIVLIAYDKELGFYQSCGLSVMEEKTPMGITTLTT